MKPKDTKNTPEVGDLVERLARLLLDNEGQDRPLTPLAPVVAAYLETLAAEGKSASYVSDVKGSLAAARKGIGVAAVQEIDSRVLLAWRSSMLAGGVSHRTANKKLDALTRCLEWAVKYEWAPRFRVPSIERLDERERHQRKVRRALTEPEVQSYVSASFALDRMLAAEKDHRFEQSTFPLLLLESGPRFSEAVAADWPSVRWQTNTIALAAGTTKGGRRREIPFSLTLRDRLERLHALHASAFGADLTCHPVFLGPRGTARLRHPTALRRHYKVLAAAGIPRRDAEGREVDLHALRYTAAVRAISAAGLDLSQVGEMLGHKDIRLTKAVYVRHGAQGIAARLDGLPGYERSPDGNPTSPLDPSPSSPPEEGGGGTRNRTGGDGFAIRPSVEEQEDGSDA
jgi:integrase